ncbi:MAG: hypothetical protein Q9210_001171 [Variospora velana]
MPAPKRGTKRGRKKGISVYRPFIFGSIAKHLDPITRPSTINADHTHQWTLYVKPCPPHPDLSYFIKKVQFKLHETYTNSLRTIEAPPFEVTETGWGDEREAADDMASFETAPVRAGCGEAEGEEGAGG